jgi:hypothetical protein
LTKNESYLFPITDEPILHELLKGTWIVVLHASRVPPHIGIIVDGNFNSLTIKGHELDINTDVLLKTIQQKRIESIFIKLNKHPVFSSDFQKEIFQFHIKQFNQVKVNEATCLSPVKLFLQEFYALSIHSNELFFELLNRLIENNYISNSFGLNIESKISNGLFSFPIYSNSELQEIIKTEYNNYYKL